MRFILVICVTILATVYGSQSTHDNISINLISADLHREHDTDTDDFVLQQFDIVDGVEDVNGQLNYFLGKRVHGDRLVAHGQKNNQWPKLQNVFVTLDYPTSGVGATLSYISINVTQV